MTNIGLLVLGAASGSAATLVFQPRKPTLHLPSPESDLV